MSELINEIKQDLYGVKNKKDKKNTLMEMVFNDQMEMNPEEIDNPGYDTSSIEFESMEDSAPTTVKEELPVEQTGNPEIKNMLAEIRVAVIKGLQALANQPESQYYDCLKKILTIIDKPIETESRIK